MTYNDGTFFLPRYEYTSCNQHGNRYKRKSSIALKTVRLSCKYDDKDGLIRLVLLSNSLDIPVKYDFSEHIAYIDLMGVESIRKEIK